MEVGHSGPFSHLDDFRKAFDIGHKVQKQRERELRDLIARVARHVADLDAVSFARGKVDHVVSGAERADIPDFWAFTEQFFGNFRPVRKNRFRVGAALRGKLGRRFIVNGRFAVFAQKIPAQIAGVYGKAVQNRYFHRITSRLL